MKVKAFDSVCLWSENPAKLSEFYEKTLGFKVDNKVNYPDDTGTNFLVNGVFFFVGYHDKVHGKSKDPYRIMPVFVVDSVDDVYKELVPKGVKFVRKPAWAPEKMYRATTILDPEGNIIQFFSDYKT